MVGLDDLSGTDEPSLSVGVLSAAPIDGTNPSYDGTDDLDWWYAVDRTLIDAQRQPLNQLTGSIAGNIQRPWPVRTATTGIRWRTRCFESRRMSGVGP